jgi:hypothetical protein
MENLPPLLFFTLLLGFIVLLPALIGLLVRLIAPKVKREDLAGLLGIPFLFVLFMRGIRLTQAPTTCSVRSNHTDTPHCDYLLQVDTPLVYIPSGVSA